MAVGSPPTRAVVISSVVQLGVPRKPPRRQTARSRRSEMSASSSLRFASTVTALHP